MRTDLWFGRPFVCCYHKSLFLVPFYLPECIHLKRCFNKHLLWIGALPIKIGLLVFFFLFRDFACFIVCLFLIRKTNKKNLKNVIFNSMKLWGIPIPWKCITKSESCTLWTRPKFSIMIQFQSVLQPAEKFSTTALNSPCLPCLLCMTEYFYEQKVCSNRDFPPFSIFNTRSWSIIPQPPLNRRGVLWRPSIVQSAV